MTRKLTNLGTANKQEAQRIVHARTRSVSSDFDPEASPNLTLCPAFFVCATGSTWSQGNCAQNTTRKPRL